jgi:hypothetical protein
VVRDAQGRRGQPVGLSAPWLARQYGVDKSAIESGKRWLARHGLITHVEDANRRRGRPLQLWAVQRHGDGEQNDAASRPRRWPGGYAGFVCGVCHVPVDFDLNGAHEPGCRHAEPQP